MNGPARLEIRVRQGDTIVHEYQRATSQPTAAGIVKMLTAAMGWMQAYAGAINDDQWCADVARAAMAQSLAEEHGDGSPVVSASPRP